MGLSFEELSPCGHASRDWARCAVSEESKYLTKLDHFRNSRKVMVEAKESIKHRVKGRWVTVPVVKVNGHQLVSRGKWLKIAKIRSEEMLERDLENPEELAAALRKGENRRLGADIFSFTQKPPLTRARYSYPLEWESVATIVLNSYKEWWEGLPQETRKNVRRSQKRGVVVRVMDFDDELIEGLRSVNDNSPTRQGTKNAYYGLTAEETKDRYGEFLGRCDFICAYSGEEMIGFLHLVYRGSIAAILNLTTKPSHFDKRPANALVAKAVEICERRGMSHVGYGQYNYGNKRDSPLREFKIRNGFVEVLMPRYYVPLTLWGRICIKFGFHRGLLGNLPTPVIMAGLRARELWYNRKILRPV
jgi:hypothetical protein